jgi:putative DNA primase/helicase
MDGVPHGERSEKFHYVVKTLSEAGHSAEAIHDLLIEYPGGIAEKFWDRLSQEIERVLSKPSTASSRKSAQEEFSAVGRPTIKIAAGELHNLATAGEQALIAAGEPLYVRGPQVVRPVIDDAEAAHGQRTKVVRLTAVTSSVLVDRLNRVARWAKYSVREKKDLSADAPKIVADTILSRDGEWRFPPLAGVITTPTLRPDGSLLSVPGYDPASRLLLIDPPPMPEIPVKPTKAHAAAALALLDGLLSEFPFVDDASRSVALSAMISPVVRGALAAVPMHMWRAPTAGSSKSFGVDVASTIATGQRCPVISAGAREEETEKRLGAAVMTGQPIVCVDNVNGELGGDALCQLIERPTVDIRILGRSEMVRVENRATIYATGNNIVVVGDMVRRVLVVSLDANEERPELRRFKQDPLALILADRGKYVAACLTVVRAYLEANCPDPQPALASFGDWSRLVRSALVWLGRADPLLTMETARAEDPELATLQQVVAAWRDAVGVNVWQTTGELAATDNPLFREALQEVSATRRHGFVGIDTRMLAKWLSRRKGRIIEGLKIVAEFDRKAKQQTWALWDRRSACRRGG